MYSIAKAGITSGMLKTVELGVSVKTNITGVCYYSNNYISKMKGILYP